MTSTLTPEGATLLRQARDYILTNPADFDWGDWDRCIAGHVNRLAGQIPQPDEWLRLGLTRASRAELASIALGFRRDAGSCSCSECRPTFTLFCGVYGSIAGPERYDVRLAARRINEFLWSYGYPPDEMKLPAAQEAPMECQTIS